MSLWWIDEPLIIGSTNPTQNVVNDFMRTGGTVIVSLLNEPMEPPRYRIASVEEGGCSRYNFPVPDFQAPTLEQLKAFARLLQQLPSSSKMLVHCEGGLGRTGTFAAAYWIWRGLSSSKAIAKISVARPYAIDSKQQERVLEQLASVLR
jgi:atypical dual specificity phosphatase